ncbi:MAG: aromatic ring-hydroxylating dioxygenase subunit alpha [Parvularculaceae bacterium]
MTFLKNAWYAAGWEEDLSGDPIARTFLNEPVVLFRDSTGAAVALADRCPHRFAPLSLGKVEGDAIRCPYHGLVFDKGGACVRNPHGKGARPSSLSVRTYPLLTQNGMIWIWMGDKELAGGSRPPAYDFLTDNEHKTLHGSLHVRANYELVTDNLLDLSHAEFLHPFIMPEGVASTIKYSCLVEGDTIGAIHEMPDQDNTPLFRLLMPDVRRIDGRANNFWRAPANMYLDVGMRELDSGERRDCAIPQVHLLTPETEFSTHYFWAAARLLAKDDQRVDDAILAGFSNAFENEDEPMIRAVQERMGGVNLFELDPALLPMDEASVRARRELARLIRNEQERAAG